MIISIDGNKKAFNRIQDPFMIKALTELGVKGKYLHLIKIIYEKPIAIIQNRKN
jgi:hypothetical protein